MENQQPTLEYAISDDKSSITLTLGQEKLTLSTQEFENVLGNMGFTRAMLQPPVPITPDNVTMATPLEAMYFRHVVKGGVPVKDGAELAVRSNKFGWLSYRMDPQFCQGIAAWLTGETSEMAAPAGTNLN